MRNLLKNSCRFYVFTAVFLIALSLVVGACSALSQPQQIVISDNGNPIDVPIMMRTPTLPFPFPFTWRESDQVTNAMIENAKQQGQKPYGKAILMSVEGLDITAIGINELPATLSQEDIQKIFAKGQDAMWLCFNTAVKSISSGCYTLNVQTFDSAKTVVSLKDNAGKTAFQGQIANNILINDPATLKSADPDEWWIVVLEILAKLIPFIIGLLNPTPIPPIPTPIP